MNPKLSHIQTLIQQTDFPNAINQLLELTKDSNYYNEVILHSANFKELQKNDRQGILSPQDILQQKNRLTSALLDLINELNSNITQPTNNNVQNSDLLDIIKLLANKPINIENKAVSQGNITQTHSGSGDNVAGDKNTTYNYNSQNVSEAITEVQTICQQVAQEYPNDPTNQGIKTIEIINNNPTLKQKLITAAKEGGLAALEKALDNPVGAFAIAAIKSWIT
ncbi:MAG: hypothetical protein QNJ37_22760 [Crocosphaera sp.]|nr:hypothetical protein [Crocosphaera sp.]